MTSDAQIRIEYVPIDQVIRWEQNPKRHDIGAIAESIRRFGFRDPPAFDSTLGALVHGNGRTETLVWMRDEGQEPPRGIAIDDRGRWCMPVVFGNDAESTTEAVAYAIAHNNLTMAGGDYTALDMSRMWDDTYLPILRDLAEAEALPPTMDEEALGTLLLAASPEGPDVIEDSETPEPTEELQAKWGTATGQTWRIPSREGDHIHTLFCGPTESAHIRCDIAIYDPPFDWSAAQQETALAWVSWQTAVLMGLHHCMPLAARHDYCHWWVWDSGMARFGGKGYKPMSGCAIVLVFGEKRNFHEPQALAALDRAGLDHYGWTVQVVQIQDHLANRLYKHEKPMPLWDYIVSLYSAGDQVIGDPFAGSGSVLVACENLKREYHGAELSPLNAAVILERYERTFGITPQLAVGAS